LGASAEEIPFILDEYVKEARAITKDITDIMWYMRGSLNREDAYHLSPKEREYIIALIQKNIENTSKSGIALL